jgi:hypothetical protein
MLLIITNEEDIHPNPVIDKLIELEVPFFRLNTESLISHYDITYEISNSSNHFSIKYKDGSHVISGDQITSVWERRPIEPLTTFDKLDEEVSKLVLEEVDGFLRYFRYSLANLPWIGHAVNERKAGSKILQKIVARNLKLNIPDTLFTNELDSIEEFQHEKIAIKPIYAHVLEKNKEETYVFYTSLQNKSEILKLGEIGVRNTINFLESYVEKDFEVRATVIDDAIYAASINSQSFDDDKGKIDWRQGYDHGIKFSRMDLPRGISEKCFKFLEYFELRFGCFDFIVDTKGNYHFLECNTNGQWLWLEEEAGLPISEKLAKTFQKYYLQADVNESLH